MANVIALHMLVLCPSFYEGKYYVFTVEQDCMLVIRWDIRLLIFWPDSKGCRVSMFCIRWDGMHLGCQLNNMLLMYVFDPKTHFI